MFVCVLRRYSVNDRPALAFILEITTFYGGTCYLLALTEYAYSRNGSAADDRFES